MNFRNLIFLPHGAYLKRDRGASAYITNAESIESEAFYLENGRVFPTDSFLFNYRGKRDDFADSLERFSSCEISNAARELFIEGIKLSETAQNIDMYEKKLRQQAAVALRTGRGGGLWQCAMLLADIKGGYYEN